MKHLTKQQLYSYTIDQTKLSADQVEHLDTCEPCRLRLNVITQMMRELTIARRSHPSAAALQRYQQLFAEVQKKQPSSLSRLWHSLPAQLAWDGRQNMALVGMRSASMMSYRLLYTTERADIELLVEPRNGVRHLEGEILALRADDRLGPALVQLQATALREIRHETESDAQGRFRFAGVSPAQYQLSITPWQGPLLQIDTLEIT